MDNRKQRSSATLLDVDESILTNRLLLQEGEAYEKKELSQLMPDSREASAITISPEAGMCVKTKLLTGDNSKVFVNVCTSGSIPPPEDLTDDELLEILNSEEPSNFRIPMSIGEPHDELDKSGKPCTAYDVVMNPDFLSKARDSLLFNNFVVIAILEALEVKYSIELDKNGWTILKNKLYLGTLKKRSVRVAVPLVQELSGLRRPPQSSNSSEDSSLLTELSSRPLSGDGQSKPDTKTSPHASSPALEKKPTRHLTPVETRQLSSGQISTQKKKPKYELERLLSENAVGPKEMVGIAVRLQLPGQVEGAGVSVMVSNDSVVVETASYFLDLPLPCVVQPGHACSFFVKEKQALLVRAPLMTTA